MGRILAIDFGRKRVGFATTDESKIIVKTLEQMLFQNPNFWVNLEELLQTINPELIILGYPHTDFDEKTNLQNEILNFQKKLKSITKCIITLRDETFTSEAAKSILSEIDTKHKKSKKAQEKSKKKLDSVAAGILLKNYLEE